MSSDSQIDLLNKLKEEFIKVTDNLRDQQTRGPPSSNERSTKRRKRDRDQEEAEGRSDLSATEGSEDLNKSVAPSRCSSETRGNILEFTAAGLAQLRVPKERFDEIITLEPEFPPELPGLVYDDLAKQLRFHKCIEDMNEMTRQTIVHSLLVTICSFINSKHPEKSAPVIELNKSLIWFYKEKRLDNKSRKINLKIDISMVDGSDEKLYYLVIEMNAINCYEGAKHGLIHLKRIRELNKKDKVCFSSKMICQVQIILN